MEITLKEQLVYLVSCGVTYKWQMQYLQACAKGDHSEPASLADCQRMLRSIPGADGGYRMVNFFKVADCYDSLLELSQQAFIIGEAVYPKLWYETAQPPLVLFYAGDLSMLQRPKVSIVGTRKTTPYGAEVTKALIKEFAKQNWIAVSGLAHGIDSTVHQAAIEAGNKTTIAIIPTGIQQVYPKEHRAMQEQLGQHHLVISEYLPSSLAQRHHFVLRNRLVAGISPATLVIEAAKKSGSLITANYALQENREVFALPGRIKDSQSSGCNELIAAGARPILSVGQTIWELAELFQNQGHI